MSKIYTAISDDDDNRWVEIDGKEYRLYQSRENGPFYFSDKDRDREPVAILPEPHNLEAWRIFGYLNREDKETVSISRHRIAGWLAKVDPATANVHCTPIAPSMDYRATREVLAIVDLEKGAAWVWPNDDGAGPCSDLLGVCNDVLKANSAASTIMVTADDLPSFTLTESDNASDSFPFESRTTAKASA
jgi:hypothetical protein